MVGKVSPSPNGMGFIFQLEDGPLWNLTPSDGEVVEKERFLYSWLVVTSYVVNSIVIVAAAICLIFTIAFRNRK